MSDTMRLQKYGPESPRRGPELRDQAEPGQLAFGQPSLVLCSLPTPFSRAPNPRAAGVFPQFTIFLHALRVQAC